MFIKQSICVYPDFSSLLDQAIRTGHYPSPNGIKQIIDCSNPSDSLLYTQSNGHALIGHDKHGRLGMITTPQDHDYPLTTLCASHGEYINTYPGMYYQADIAMMLSKLYFELELENGQTLSTLDDSESCYLNYFLPMTTKNVDDIRLTTLSLAPILEPSMPSAIPGLPLPGPGGAIHTMVIENRSPSTLKGKALLKLTEKFIARYEDDGAPVEQHANSPHRREWDRNLYLLCRPDANAAIHAMNFNKNNKNEYADESVFYRDIEILPGESLELTCYIALSVNFNRLRPTLAYLYSFSMLEWINIAATFWADRLGDIQVSKDDKINQQSIDFIRRCILDNFNCLQMNPKGEIVVHWQGAPAHQCARLWGIDAEPTAISVLYTLPELGAAILRYCAYRNRPHYLYYPDHSVPNLLAPLCIAAQYIELTGDTTLFHNNPSLLEELRKTADTALTFRHPCGLLHSHYSSDGHVFNRYDYGTNVKAYRALSGFAALLEALGKDGSKYKQAASMIPTAIDKHMTQEGPFGLQICGGNNLGEWEPFYLPDKFFYYDGEDSSSCVAPLYGACEFDDEKWRNYHRYARSLFATNYDPELDVLRWFYWGGPIDGTALVSAVGGAVTRDEMRTALENMLAVGCDETGSMFWWSKGKNSVRWLTRCSQGQGFWVYQHTEQWLGLHMNALTNTLTVRPQGMYGSYRINGARLGSFLYDIEWQETQEGILCTVTNRNEAPVTVRVYAGSKNAGLSDAFSNQDCVCAPGETQRVFLNYPDCKLPVSYKITETESKLLAAEGIFFDTVGLALPGLDQKGANGETVSNVYVLRMVVVTDDKPLKSASVELDLPEGFTSQAKELGMWKVWGDEPGPSRFDIGDIPPRSRAAVSFYIEANELSAPWMLNHPAKWPLNKLDERTLLFRGEQELAGVITATLNGVQEDGSNIHQFINIDIRTLSKDEYDAVICDALGGCDHYKFSMPKHL